LWKGHLAKINNAFAQSYPLLLWIKSGAAKLLRRAIFPPSGLPLQADSLALSPG
jgi:hypothetical protein